MNNSYDTRVWITRKRQEVVEAMAKLEAKLSVYDDLLRDLPMDKYEQMVEATEITLAKQPVKQQKRSYPANRVSHPPMGRKHTVDLALEAAGDDGITAKQLAEVASLPIGTASSILTQKKAQGLVLHDPQRARYFAVHSEQQDNNTDDGGST